MSEPGQNKDAAHQARVQEELKKFDDLLVNSTYEPKKIGALCANLPPELKQEIMSDYDIQTSLTDALFNSVFFKGEFKNNLLPDLLATCQKINLPEKKFKELGADLIKEIFADHCDDLPFLIDLAAKFGLDKKTVGVAIAEPVENILNDCLYPNYGRPYQAPFTANGLERLASGLNLVALRNLEENLKEKGSFIDYGEDKPRLTLPHSTEIPKIDSARVISLLASGEGADAEDLVLRHPESELDKVVNDEQFADAFLTCAAGYLKRGLVDMVEHMAQTFKMDLSTVLATPEGQTAVVSGAEALRAKKKDAAASALEAKYLLKP